MRQQNTGTGLEAITPSPIPPAVKVTNMSTVLAFALLQHRGHARHVAPVPRRNLLQLLGAAVQGPQDAAPAPQVLLQQGQRDRGK